MRAMIAACLVVLVMSGYAGANGACDHVNLLQGEQVDNTAPMPPDTYFPIERLPKGLQVIVGTTAWSPNGTDAPEEVKGFITDLNGDGSGEYFLVNEAWSGAHNWSYQVFALHGGTWKVIGSIFGGMAAVLKTGTMIGNTMWREYVVIARVEYGKYSSAVYAFNGTSYVNVRGKHCDEGIVSDYRK